MLLARLRTTATATRSFQTRGLANMLGAATSKTEKADETADRGDIVLGALTAAYRTLMQS